MDDVRREATVWSFTPLQARADATSTPLSSLLFLRSPPRSHLSIKLLSNARVFPALYVRFAAACVRRGPSGSGGRPAPARAGRVRRPRNGDAHTSAKGAGKGTLQTEQFVSSVEKSRWPTAPRLHQVWTSVQEWKEKEVNWPDDPRKRPKDPWCGTPRPYASKRLFVAPPCDVPERGTHAMPTEARPSALCAQVSSETRSHLSYPR